MTYREEILTVVRDLVRDRPTREFTLDEVIREMQTLGSNCKVQTIKTYVAGIMCVNAPKNYRTRHPHFERMGAGRYHLL